jgi:FkbM family methyltransferase
VLLKKILSKVSASSYVQKVLERNVRVAQYLMGVGSGSDVSSSGEQSIFRVLKQRFRPPYCIFDVGSNEGQFLQVVLDNLASKDLSIHCFEPGHETFKSLVGFSKEPRVLKSIRFNNIGIGKEEGEAVLHSDRLGSGLASLTKRRLDHHGIYFEKSETVKIGTIDNYCSENAISHIHLLKIDIEGHELDALLGAKRMFETKSIDMVSFEFGGTNIDTRTFFRDFWFFFTEAEMRIFRITPSGYLSPIDSYDEIHEQFAPTNFIAVSIG